MKNFLHFFIGLFIVSSFFSCKKADINNDMNLASSATTSSIIQSAPYTPSSTSRVDPGAGYSIGLLADWILLGTNKTEVHLEEDMVANGGKTGVGPAGKFKLEDDGVLNGNVYLHHGVQIVQMAGIINGSYNQEQNLASLDGELNRVAKECADMTPTLTLNDVQNTTTILGNGTFNVINMHKLNLDNSDQLILSGNSSEQFIINVTYGMQLSGTAKIITAGGARSSNVLINIIGNKSATSTINNTINATIVINDGSAQLGNVNGQILCGGKQLMTADNGVYNFIPFGS